MGERQEVTVRPATLDDVAEMSRVFVDTFHAAHRGQIPEALVLERTYETSRPDGGGRWRSMRRPKSRESASWSL